MSTFDGSRALTGASGFFFERGGRLRLATRRHGRVGRPTRHDPSRIKIDLHSDGPDLTQSFALSLLLYRDGRSQRRQGVDAGGEITLHHLPVVREAVIASSFGLRFQGEGYVLTDARTRRGTSGAPVVMRAPDGPSGLPRKLLGVHSARMDMGTRDLLQDESLGLNCTGYADVPMALTEAAAPPGPAAEPG